MCPYTFNIFLAYDKVLYRRNYKHFSSIINLSISGEITSRLTSDTTTMSDTLGLNVNIFLRSLIKSAGVLFFMLKLSWRLTLITFIGLPCMLAVSNLYGKYYKVNEACTAKLVHCICILFL